MPIATNDPIIVAPSPTPFADDESVDYEAIATNVARWQQTSLSGFVLNSENGEESFLSEAEQLQIVRTVRGVLDGDRLIVGGVDSPSVRETLRKSELLVEAGADLIRVRIPRLTDDVGGYFRQVAESCPAPVVMIHQMAPGSFLASPTGHGAAAELIGELVSLDNMFGYIASGDMRFECRVRQFVPKDRRFWIGNGTLLLGGAVSGADGACLMLANIAPAACREIFECVAADEISEAQRIQQRLIELDWQVLSRGAAGLKAALGQLGFAVGRPRSPASVCSAVGFERIHGALQAARLL